MYASRDIYARRALSQVSRLLGNQDRDAYSPTYGCLHRDYWLYKTSDFPDAVRQFGVHALALVYRHDFPGNFYKGQPKMLEWTTAGLSFWAQIQHREGSFDEFYPYERGWVGPTGFTTYAIIEAFRLIQDEVPAPAAARVGTAIRRAARFIARGQSEEDHLANHHAMGCLAVWKAYELLGDGELKEGFARLWKGFLQYHHAAEGWCKEYDGVDPGYLSAVVSFLGKIYQTNPDPEIFEVLQRCVEFCGPFVYPNGFYAGSLGSRNTGHFYPHGFEILAGKIPLAAAIAENMLRELGEGKLVPPEIMSDRYVVYRVPELLQAYLDYTPRPASLPPLPYERGPFRKYFPAAGIYVAVEGDYYVVANLAKGGVLKVFDRHRRRALLNDCGLIGQLTDGRVVSSQGVSAIYERGEAEGGWTVSGFFMAVPTHKLFTPLKNLLFRATLVAVGWSPRLSHLLKGYIRKVLILRERAVPVRFRRRFRVQGGEMEVHDEVQVERRCRFTSLRVGDEFYVRFVPQSRFFQSQELDARGHTIDAAPLERLNAGERLVIRRAMADAQQGEWKISISSGNR